METAYLFFLLSGLSCVWCASRIKRQSEETPVVFPDYEEIPEISCVAADGSEGVCRPTGLCVFRFDSIKQSELSSCVLNRDDIGICCPKKPPPTRGTGPIRPIAEDPVIMPDISLNELDSAGEEGLSIVQQIDQLELELKRKGLFTKENSKEYYHQAFFRSRRKDLARLGRDGLSGVEATLKLVKTFQLDSVQSREGLRRFSLTNTVLKDTCPKVPPCSSTKYRTVDGSCNNLENRTWGKSFTAFTRLLSPRYYDGINSPRISYDGGPLPSPREVSYRSHTDLDRPSRKFSVFFMEWGEFLAHDLTHTGLTTANGGEGITCCHEEIQKNPKLLHPACLPIYIPSNDPFYAKHGAKCMDFVRSLPAPRPDCNFGPREQLNQVTAFIDASVIYGSTENETASMRTFKGGLLKTSFVHGEELLPFDDDRSNICMLKNSSKKCFRSGDSRVNEQPMLTLMHTIWVREHNRLAAKLSRLNSGWNDEILFREARRIVGAAIQHITYTEYLPLLLGRKLMSSFKLTPKLAGFSFDYDAKLNPGITNAFAAAAFRMGHSLVQKNLHLISKDNDVLYSVPLKETYFAPGIMYDNGTIEMLSRGMATQSAQFFDRYVNDHLTNYLFETPEHPYGLDLVAMNIQRGRDHGLAGYNEWREHCGLPRISNFEELLKVMDESSARNFSRLYRNVDDIDLYPAGISETPLPDANLGPTFSCIVAEQFRRLKHGDRFWYENGGMESSFTNDQLAEIRKVTFARILCDNTKIGEVQLVAFLKPSTWNPVERCKSDKIAEIDLFPWRNEPVWT